MQAMLANGLLSLTVLSFIVTVKGLSYYFALIDSHLYLMLSGKDSLFIIVLLRHNLHCCNDLLFTRI